MSGVPYPPPTPAFYLPIFNSEQYLPDTTGISREYADSRYVRLVKATQTITGDITISGSLTVSAFSNAVTFRSFSGSAAFPAYTFLADSTTGVYHATNLIGFSVGGVARATIGTSGLTVGTSTNQGSTFSQIRRGTGALACLAGPSTNSQAVTFSSAFASTPSVLITIQNAGTNSIGECVATVGSVSTTGCVVWLTRPAAGVATTINYSYLAFT